MTTTNNLSADKREGTGKGVARKLRASGRVPAVLYGKDMESVSLSVDAHEAGLLFQAISVDNTIVHLDIEGEKESVQTLVRDIQSHAFRPELLHIDFLRIQKGVVVDVEIPVHLTGLPVGVKLGGGTLEQIFHELPVRCIPSKIPESLDIDVSGLDIGESMHISDIVVPEGVELMVDPSRTICAVSAPRAEVEEVDEEGLGDAEGMVDGGDAESGEAESGDE